MRLDLTPPKGWSILPLSRIITGLRGGVSVNGTDLPARNGEPGVLKLSAISYGQFAPEQNKAVIENERSRLGPSVRGNTILISRSNTTELVGACVYVSEDFPHLYLPDLIWEIEVDPSNGNSAKWLSYMLSSGAVRASLMARATGTSGSMKKLSMAALRVMQIWQPPLPEQERIAEIITTWDTAIAQTAKLIEARRKLKKGLMQQLLTSKCRFLKATDTWSRINLGSAIRCYSGGTPSRTNDSLFEGSIPWIKSGELNSKDIYSTEESISEEAVNESAVKYVYPNTLLYALYGATAGVPAFSKIRATINQAVLAIIPDESLNSEYLYYWLLHSRQHLRQKYTQGGQPNLSAQLVKEFEVPVPSLAEQKCIVSILNTIDQEIETLCRLSDRLKEQKRGLMQKLLTGQIRVKTTEEITAS